MTLLAVRRPALMLAGRQFVRGETFDSTELPQIGQMKWAQLIEHRYVDMIDKPGVPIELPEEITRDEIAARLGFPCACGFVGKTEQGLRIHQAKKHKE